MTKRIGLLAASLLVCALTGATTAHAADPMSIDAAIGRGVTQLEGVQLPDGGLGARLPVRDSATAAEALRRARPASPAIARIDAFLSPLALDDVDDLARVALGSPSPGYASQLLAAQNDDGGFGLSGAYQSDALDTALALRALSALGERDGARRATDRLLKFSTAGVWGGDGGDVSLTGEALLALDAYIARYGSTSAIDTALAGAISWLGDSQQADGSWSPGSLSVRNTALALVALASSPAAVSRVGSGADALLGAQLPDGSWGDPYTTALAIRALHRAREAIERDRVAQLPDASVQARDLTANPQLVDAGKPVTITAKVTNLGVATASGVTAELFLDDPASGVDPVASAAVPDLAPAAQASVDATFDLNVTRPRTRVYVVLRAPVGQDRDLANNSAFINVYVRGAHKNYVTTRDWPRPGRDIQHSGATPNHLHPGVDPTPIWRTHADGGQTVAEAKVYFGDGSDLKAVDAKTGALAWKQDHSVYYGTDDRYRPPIYNRGYVFKASPGTAGAFQAKTGEYQYYGIGGWGGDVPIWGVDVIPQEHGRDAVFMYLAQYEWINQDGQHCRIKAIGGPTAADWGAPVWPGSGPSGALGTIALSHPCDGQPLAFASDGSRGFFSSDGYLIGFNAATGVGPNGEPSTPLFDVKLPGMARATAAPLVDSLGQVITAGWEGTPPPVTDPTRLDLTGRGRVVAADPSDGTVYWSFTTDTPLDGSPVEYGGAIIVVDRSGRIYALDQTTGALRWSWRPDGYVPPAPDQQGKSGQTLALAGRYLYVPHPDGHIYTLDARDGTQLSATAFSGRPYDLAIDDTNNAIYVRTLDGYVGAYPTHELATQCGPDGTNAPPAPGAIDRVSFNPDGSQLTGTGASFERPAISANGRYVAFASGPQLYVRDLDTGQTTALPAVDQVTKDITRSGKHAPVLSADGRYLGFVARTQNSRTGDDVAVMYVMDRQTGVTEPVLKNPDGSIQYVALEGAFARPTDLDNPPMSISDDGQTVAFASNTNGIVPGDTDNAKDVFVVDRATGARTLVSTTSDGQQSPADSASASLSRDGRYVAFTSMASLTGAPIAIGNYDRGAPYTYLYDRAAGHLTAVSVNSSGALVQGYSPYVSGDGRFVAFSSLAPSLLPPLMRNPDWYGYGVDAFVFDRTSGQVEFASMNDAGEHTRVALARHPVLSDDGRYVAFQNTGLFAKGVTSYDQPQIIARDRTAGTTEQISHNSWGVSALGTSVAPGMSADGSRVAFISTATDLVDGDTNNARDVFVYDRSRSGTAAGRVNPPDPGGACPVTGGGTSSYSDLSVEPGDIQPSTLEQGQSGQVDVSVHNTGGAASEATIVRLYDGDASHGTLIGEQSLGPVAAGASTTLSFTWNPVAAAGQHKLTAVVDPDRAVFEQKLDNDEAERSVDVAAPRLDVTVGPDKQAYSANEAARFAAHLTNSSVAARDVRLVESIRDEAGDDVASVHDGQVPLAPNGDATVDDAWNTQDTTPGRYTVSARLLNAVGDELASADSSFEIKPDVAAGLALQSDELTYAPGDTATIGALVSNRSANSTLSGAHVRLAFTDPHGSELDHWDLPAGDVPQGRSALLNQDKSLRGLEPGTYHTSAKLIAADGSELAQATGQLALRSSADTGDGVRGSLTANPTDPRRFGTVAFQYSLTDSGNADIPGATVRVRISALDGGQTLKTLDAARTITRGGPNTGSLSTMVDLVENRDYQASLHLVLADGSERPLDRAIIHVRPQQLYYGASFDSSPRNRVLVWACDAADETAARTALGDTFATYVRDHAVSGYQRGTGYDRNWDFDHGWDYDGDADDGRDRGCGRFGHDELDRFTRLLRSGDYNQFWLLGHHHPLHGSVDDELAARVIQGDGLLVAGGDPGSDLFSESGNASPLGADFAGTLPPGSYTLQFAPGSAFAGLDAQVAGSPVKVTTTQATAVATTRWGPASNRKTAVTATYNQFGQGKAVYVGVPPSAFADQTRAAAVLSTAGNVLLPAAAATRAGGLARFDLFIEGTAPGSPLELRTQLPAGIGVPQPPADAMLAGGVLTLPFETAGSQRKLRSVWLKLPTGAGSAATASNVYYRDAADGQTKQYGTPVSASIDITENKQSAKDAALAALGRIGNVSRGEQARLQKIKDDVAAAAQTTRYPIMLWYRLHALLDDIGTLERSRWTNVAPARSAVARLVTYVEYDYYLAGGH